MYLPALPRLARDRDTNAPAVQLTLALFVAGLAAGQALYGPVADRLGRRRPLLFGCALYALASVGCALVASVGWLIGLRLVQALGGCAGVVLARAVVRDLFDPRGAARMFSLLMLVMGLAPITAPLIGGQLLLWFGWRAIFWLLAAFGGMCVLLVLLGLPAPRPPARRVGTGRGQALGT